MKKENRKLIIKAVQDLRKAGWNDTEISIVLGFPTAASLRRTYAQLLISSVDLKKALELKPMG